MKRACLFLPLLIFLFLGISGSLNLIVKSTLVNSLVTLPVLTLNPVSEPAVMFLAGIGLIMLANLSKRIK